MEYDKKIAELTRRSEEILAELTRRSEEILEQLGLLQRLKELEGGEVAPAKAKAAARKLVAQVEGEVKRGRGRPPKAKVEGAPAAAGEAPVKRGRGRPRKVVADAAAAAAPVEGEAPVKRGRGRPPKAKVEGEEKALKLPAILETIGQNLNNKSVTVADVVKLVREAGYKSKAENFGNMVYQAMLKLTKAGVYTKNAEDRTYQYVGKKAA